MKTGRDYKFWFCTGSQDLYGDECLRKVAEHSKIIVEELNKSGVLPFEVVWKPTLITNELIRKTFNDANADENCAGVIAWMHTFSPAKSWILGLKEYRKPLCHLHTQFNVEIPYDTIDMDFMNENQSAHGGREFGHMVTRMGIERMPLIEPLETRESKKIEELALVIDTSYSTSGALVRAFLAETYTLLKGQENFFHRMNLHLIQADNAIRQDLLIRNEDELIHAMNHFELRGGGGTDFRPAFAYVAASLPDC